MTLLEMTTRILVFEDNKFLNFWKMAKFRLYIFLHKYCVEFRYKSFSNLHYI